MLLWSYRLFSLIKYIILYTLYITTLLLLYYSVYIILLYYILLINLFLKIFVYIDDYVDNKILITIDKTHQTVSIHLQIQFNVVYISLQFSSMNVV